MGRDSWSIQGGEIGCRGFGVFVGFSFQKRKVGLERC